jgi:DNA mismatch repair protein MutS2
MDEHTLRILEFSKILSMASAFAVTEPGGRQVLQIRPLNDAEKIRHHIALITESRIFFSEGRPFGIEHFEDLIPLFHRVRPADAVLEPFDVRSFLPLFYSAFNLKILSSDPSCAGIGQIASGLTTHPDLKKQIENAIDREGKISDKASPELARIRQGIKSCERKIQGVLEGILKQKDLAPHLQDYFLAERNSRWVIPVKIDSKGSVPGIIHDISNTGETVYVEPYSIQHLGNDLESYRAEEKLEEYRILRMLSSLIRVSLTEIEDDYAIVAEIDALQAVAGFSEQMNMSSPELNERGYVNIVGGRHPVLWNALKKDNRDNHLVPLNIEIGKDQSCMVITGSNAGGKTVALKTIGVLTLMALSGMHIPAQSGTTIPFLNQVLADIGDEQSIEQNLSTFSAHITRISQIVEKSSSRAMIIIDELGTGTDPEQGGALSCAILRKLRQKGAISLISTHLGMLKAFAHAQTGMMNSSMEMKEVIINGAAKYRPTYKLVMGEPGTSYAVEIAESLGLQKDIIREARGIMTGEGSAIESLISDLKQKNSELDIRLKEAEELKKEVDDLQSKVKDELLLIQSGKDRTMSEALKEAGEIIRKTRVEARDIVRAIKKCQASESANKLKALDKTHEEIKKMQKQYAPEKIRALRKVTEGQHVFINTLGTHGTVHSINKKARKCRVLVEGKEITVPISALAEPVEDLKKKQKASGKGSGPAALRDISDDMVVERELKVIGQRVDPAISLIERFLNDASLAGVNQVKIIHGIGEGILSRAIREYLQDHPLAAVARKGNEDEGGEAVTIVKL